MTSWADFFPPGTDLCQIPSRPPPTGQVTNFNNVGLAPITIAYSVILTTIAVIFASGRLFANRIELGLSDLFVLLAALCNIAHAILRIIYTRYNRHMWNLPLCWINGQFVLAVYIFEVLNIFSLFFSKSATLLLFKQLFAVSRTMKGAIWAGMAVTFLLYGSSLPFLSYFAAPHAGQTWDELAVYDARTTIFPLYWGVAQGSIGTLLDVYIFILPLPTLSRLRLSTKRKLQLLALFFVGIFGVVASSVSLAYRAISTQGPSPDYTYNGSVLLNCNLIEMNIALIICSTPGFANFMRKYIMTSRFFIRSTMGCDKQKRVGEEHIGGYIEMGDP